VAEDVVAEGVVAMMLLLLLLPRGLELKLLLRGSEVRSEDAKGDANAGGGGTDADDDDSDDVRGSSIGSILVKGKSDFFFI
jgi:hypothetical protein